MMQQPSSLLLCFWQDAADAMVLVVGSVFLAGILLHSGETKKEKQYKDSKQNICI
jgi:hypothetical protein